MSSPTRAGTRIPVGDVRRGTFTFSPSIRQRRPSAPAIVCGSSGGVPSSLSAAVSTTAADDAGQKASLLLRGAELGDRQRAPITSVWSNGSGATVRPCSWRMRHSSRKP